MLKVGGGTLPLLETLPGIHSLLCGLVFPVGLVMIVMNGVDLLTSNMMYGTLPFMANHQDEEKIQFNSKLLSDVCRYSGISFVGNLTACVAIAALFSTAFGYGGIATFACSIAVAKTSLPFFVAFWKAIFANWLVNIAVLMQASTTNSIARIILIWIPICIFVTVGFEHSVANMFLIPFGIFSGAEVTWSQFFINNLFPVVLGNFVGAAFLVCFMHSKAFLSNQ